MDEEPTSYLLPSLEVHWIPTKQRHGVFAHLPIPAGTVLTVWSGRVMAARDFLRLPPERRRAGIQVEEGLFLVAPAPEPSEHFNHSCAPNAAMCGQIVLVARRNIEVGEEVCMDYAMTDGLPYDEFDCDCGAPTCRGRVTGNDWRRPELWARYPGGFSPFLQRRIDRVSAELAPPHTAPGAPPRVVSRRRAGAGARGPRPIA